MDGSATTAMANLMSLANIGPRVKSHFQLPSSLVLTKRKLPMQYTITTEVYIDKTENQV